MTDADRSAEPDGGVTVSAAETASQDGTGRALLASRVGAIAWREFRVVTRTRWTGGIAVLFGLFSLAIVGLAGSQVGTTRVGSLFVTLAELSVYLVPMAALAVGYDAVVGPAERGTLDALFALPVPRSAVLVGTYLGRALALASGLVVGLAAGGVLFAAKHGPGVVGPYLQYTLATVGVALAFLAVSVCLSTVVSEKARALGGALLAWVWFVFVHDLFALGLVVAVQPPAAVSTLLVALNPADLLRVAVLAMVPTGGGGVGALIASTSLSLAVVAVALCAWIVAPVGLAAWLIGRRY
ncbi:ABC transporter permease [Haloarculaceae archaeon H-GB2-1]|nr:ABC transporter permease [Haloarculaceae archaeon H-GB1-1]MEA5385755.1 ABC transporter permease [Haloarculaceae archaeon H-GB11]MEA5407259.1 ABC transporter permease [Haloarculaceae archaeon H-GB2-1]